MSTCEYCTFDTQKNNTNLIYTGHVAPGTSEFLNRVKTITSLRTAEGRSTHCGRRLLPLIKIRAREVWPEISDIDKSDPGSGKLSDEARVFKAIEKTLEAIRKRSKTYGATKTSTTRAPPSKEVLNKWARSTIAEMLALKEVCTQMTFDQCSRVTGVGESTHDGPLHADAWRLSWYVDALSTRKRAAEASEVTEIV